MKKVGLDADRGVEGSAPAGGELTLIDFRGLFGALVLLLCALAAGAQENAIVVPSQHNATTSSSRATAAGSTLILLTAPSHPVLEIAGKEPEPARSLSLPSRFVGCWEGTINGFDSLEPIGFLSSYLKGTHVTYQFCYLPNSDGTTYRMELRKLVIDNKDLTATAFENQVVWVDQLHGQGYLRNHISILQTVRMLFIPFQARQDYYAEEIVNLRSPNLVRMQGNELMKLEGKDYARLGFHADFNRVPE